MSLFRIPGASSVAPSTLSASAPTVAPATTATSAARGISPTATATAAEQARAGDAGDRPFERHRARRPRRHAAERGHEVGAAAPRLADLAGDRVAPAGRQGGDERQERRVAVRSVDTASSAATAATPVLAIALPAPRRPPRSSAMPSSVLRRRPSRELIDAARNVASSSAQPGQPVVTAISDADERAGHGTRRVTVPRPITQPRDDDIRGRGEDDRLAPAQIAGHDEVVAHERQRPEHALRPRPEPRGCRRA